MAAFIDLHRATCRATGSDNPRSTDVYECPGTLRKWFWLLRPGMMDLGYYVDLQEIPEQLTINSGHGTCKADQESSRTVLVKPVGLADLAL